jgi:hypothetical protein
MSLRVQPQSKLTPAAPSVDQLQTTIKTIAGQNARLQQENRALRDKCTKNVALAVIVTAGVMTAGYFAVGPVGIAAAYNSMMATDGKIMSAFNYVASFFTKANP